MASLSFYDFVADLWHAFIKWLKKPLKAAKSNIVQIPSSPQNKNAAHDSGWHFLF